MKTQAIKLSKNEAITIAYHALAETIVQKPGIWTHLNRRVRASRKNVCKPGEVAQCA